MLKTRSPHVSIALGLLWASLASSVIGEDIDIFVGGTGGQADKPRILFVLDNTANWSRNSQHWQPQDTKQGQAEVRAIKSSLVGLTDKIHAGLMMYRTIEPNIDAGYVRHALKLLDSTNLDCSIPESLCSRLESIALNIETPVEKRPANPKYGHLMHDVYNYLAGADSLLLGNGTPSTLADESGYQTTYSRFGSPLTSANVCSDTYLVLVTNPQSNGPTTDDSSNSTALASLVTSVGGTYDKLAGQSAGTPLPLPLFVENKTSESFSAYSEACYKNETDCNKNCANEGYTKCTCDKNKTEACASDSRYWIDGTIEKIELVPTGQYNLTKGVSWNLDDWSKFLYTHGVQIPGASTSDPRSRVITYTIDVFNKQQNVDHTSLMMSAARVGGGAYFAARNQDELEAALDTIISEIISVNSTFASASLPISATNRAQNENQVFIGMFRPEPDALPRWFGNLKRYQLTFFDGVLDLADKDKQRAINTQTGFVAECATSFWTTDSVDYWSGKGVVPDPRSLCRSVTQPYSDAPDGPFVEKGAAGQRLRASVADRTVYTRTSSGTTLTLFSTSSSNLASDLVSYTLGFGADGSTARPSIHGDVVHSRPLPVNYGGTTGVTVFYGANDGTFRAVDAITGNERWAFIAPEHFENEEKLRRLMTNSPKVAYPNQTQTEDNPLQPKDYFFDGSIGQIIRYGDDNRLSSAWIYPTMRRGGRMVYAFNVTNPDSPSLMWYQGCPNLDDDTGCTSGASGLGQTWSIPNAGYVKAGSDGSNSLAVVVMGGGYDACEDAESASPSCESSKGRAVYVFDASNGNIKQTLATDRAVAADVSLVDLDYDGRIDLAYAADTGGNLYRIDLRDVDSDHWTIRKIARTQSGGRKFLYGPAVMPYRPSNEDFVYLALGSGNREQPLETDYPYASNVKDRFYVFLDKPAEDASDGNDKGYPFDLDSTSTMFDYTVSPDCAAEHVTPTSSKRGWFMNLPNQGEQTVTHVLIVAGMATFSTSRPGGSSVDICSRPIGIAAGYWVNLFNGSGAIGVSGTCGGRRSTTLAGGGMPPSPVIATVPVDGKPRTVVIGAPPRDGSTGTPISPQEIKPAIANKRERLYWSSDVDR